MVFWEKCYFSISLPKHSLIRNTVFCIIYSCLKKTKIEITSNYNITVLLLRILYRKLRNVLIKRIKWNGGRVWSRANLKSTLRKKIMVHGNTICKWNTLTNHPKGHVLRIRFSLKQKTKNENVEPETIEVIV